MNNVWSANRNTLVSVLDLLIPTPTQVESEHCFDGRDSNDLGTKPLPSAAETKMDQCTASIYMTLLQLHVPAQTQRLISELPLQAGAWENGLQLILRIRWLWRICRVRYLFHRLFHRLVPVGPIHVGLLLQLIWDNRMLLDELGQCLERSLTVKINNCTMAETISEPLLKSGVSLLTSNVERGCEYCSPGPQPHCIRGQHKRAWSADYSEPITHNHERGLRNRVGAYVGRTLRFFTGGEEHDRGEAIDLNVGVLVSGAIHLGNDDGVDVLEARRKLLVCRLEGLAVAAPGRIHLKQHILSRVQHDVIHSVSYHNLDVAILVILRYFI